MVTINMGRNRLVFGLRGHFSLLCMGLVLFTMMGCGGGDDEASTWTLSIQYHYYYYPEGDTDEGMLMREEDDNNADGVIDEYWVYNYRDDPNNEDERRLDYYNHFSGEYNTGEHDATGSYGYDDDGDLIELVHEPVDDDYSVERWEYTLSDGLRTGYTYYVDDVESETGEYTYDSNNYLIELETSNGYWLYTVGSDGVRQSYEYYEGNELVRKGTYVYDEDGNLIRLDSYELM